MVVMMTIPSQQEVLPNITKNKVARIRDVSRTKNNDGNAFENIQQSNRYDEENHVDEEYTTIKQIRQGKSCG